MTELTLKNYASKLSKDLVLLAKKNKVRECDETPKGQFIAYVDEGKDSYDVELVFGPAGKVTRHTCDCANGSAFCRHKTALLMHLSSNGKTAEPAKSKKRESKAEALLNNADADRLREWVRGLLAKNKDIELSFVHHFTVKEQPVPADVTRITNDAIKAVVGNKKNIDATQLKKLVELWAEMHAPMIAHYEADPTDEKSFLNLHAMLEACLHFELKTPSGSNKVSKFIETTLQNLRECVGNLYNEEVWDASLNFIIQNVPDGVNQVRMHYLVHLKNIMEMGSADRKLKVVDRLAKQFGKSTPDQLFNGAAYQKFIFEIIIEQNLFPQYYRLFNPIRFENEYNVQLIDLLIQNEQLDIAKRFREAQINGNYKEEYNIPYYKSLKQIFLSQNDKANLSKILAVLFPYTFDFDDYLFISGTMGEEERKKWRTKMLTRARNSSYSRSKHPMEFCFKLANHENHPRKMIEYIESYTPYQLILTYFEPMVQGDKTRLLDALIRKSDDNWYGSYVTKEQDTACFPALYALVEKHYTKVYLKAVIGNAEKSKWSYYSRLNRFMTYVKERLE